MDEITICHVKGVTHRDESTENYHPTTLSYAEIYGIFLHHYLGFWAHNFTVLVQVLCSHWRGL